MRDIGPAGAVAVEGSEAACAAVIVGLRRGLSLAEMARDHGNSARATHHLRGILADLAPELAALGILVTVPV